jgi:hypothetical protein
MSLMLNIRVFIGFLCLLLSACGGDNKNSSENPQADEVIEEQRDSSPDSASDEIDDEIDGEVNDEADGGKETQANINRYCDEAVYPSTEWTQCETQNFSKAFEATEEGLNPTFLAAELAQSTRAISKYVERFINDPSYLPVASPALNTLFQGLNDPTSLDKTLMNLLDQVISNPKDVVQLPLNTPVLTECSLQSGPCVGDPFRYPGFEGPDGNHFYENEAQVDPVVFYDSECARLAGHVWRPRDAQGELPTVVFEIGSVGASETLYLWLPQLLVRHGYAVMTFEVRGQGLSDFATPSGGLGTNINPKVFWENFVDAIDFFRSTPDTPYPNEISCKGTYPTKTNNFNPQYDFVDLDRLGIAGHSLGAIGVTAVQGYGGEGADPWPGKLDVENPVKVAVAFDGLIDPDGTRPGGAIGPVEVLLPEILGEVSRLLLLREFPNVVPRVPIMGQTSEYGLLTVPFLMPPEPEFHKGAYNKWREKNIPVYEFTIQGSTHLEWSQVPPLPGSSFCPRPETGECEGGHGLMMAEHYTAAWFDRWLKEPGESGYDSADARLLDDGGAEGAKKMSFRFNSARDFLDRSGVRYHCENIRAGCSQ